MRLSSASCAPTAPILESGSTIPTRAPITNFAKTTARGARDFVYRFFALHPVIAIAVPILALALGCLLFAFCRRTLIALIVILIGVALFLCAGSIGHAQSMTTPVGQPGVLFTRDFLRQEQSLVRRHISEAELSCDTAARLLDSHLVRDGGEELVRGLFRLDSADLLLQGQPDRIAQLKSAALSYARAEEQRKLTQENRALRQQLQNAQERVAMLRLRCTTTNEQDTMLLQVFLAKRASFRIRARAGDTDPTAVLEECRRLASVNKTEADLARLRQQVDVELAQLRRARESNNSTVLSPPATIIVTNVVRTVIEKLVPTPAPPPVTNKVLQYVTNTVIVMTNSSQAPSVGTTGTKAAMTRNETNTAAESDGVVVAEQGGATSEPKMAGSMTALLIGLGILIAIAVTVWMVAAGDRTWVVRMATNGEGASYEVQGSDRLVLGGLPHAEHHAMVNGHPAHPPDLEGGRHPSRG